MSDWAIIAALTLIVIAPLLAAIPVGECDKCEHCRNERVERALTTFCPVCLQSKRGEHPHT